ncbi:anthranilate synthase component II, partial [Nannochloropsis gaditana CCMP526]|uniref:anthranilate synthase component II n=1 Tax=Nannochloropsis gaditana (strain CCMP526) TaxID=1093141 RepID=UPI00029F8003
MRSRLKRAEIRRRGGYTHNLAHYLAEVNHGVPPTIIYNDAFQGNWTRLLAAYRLPNSTLFPFDNIVISPGPGSPEKASDFGLSRLALDLDSVPILGVCLGHQGLGYLHGGRVIRAPCGPMHGRLSQITHTGRGIFQNLPQDFPAVRYHSLVVEPPREGKKEGGREGGGQGWALKATAWSEDGTLMGLEHVARPHYGVQFHPESIGSHYGHALLRNFQRLSWERARGREGGRDGGWRAAGSRGQGGSERRA